jgi:3-deoxy-manno-octulosonate cytidylyltransferase (CMP-KDO synthetase)
LSDVVVVGVIPARLGSTRFPGKVLSSICGRPLVQHVYERLSGSSVISEVMVATDSDEVERAVAAFGGRVVRVNEPCETGSDRMAAALRGVRADIAVNLQCDQPMIDPVDIDRTVEVLLLKRRADLSTLAFGADDGAGLESRDVVKVTIDADGRALAFSRAPIPPLVGPAPPADAPLYLHHVGIYCFRRQALARFAGLPRGVSELRESLEQLRALENGMDVRVVLTDKRTVSVDRPEDIDRVASLISAG